MKRAVLCMVLAMVVCSCAWAQQDKNGKEQGAKFKAVELTDDITPPRLLEVATPGYSDEGKKKKIEGEVLLSFIVDEKGIPREVKVKKGLGYGLDENAIAALNEYRYKPAMKDEKPIAVKMDTSVSFILRNE